MPSSLIFGGSGKVARHLTSLLVKEGYAVHSMIRNKDQIDSLTALGAKPIVQSIETASVQDLTETIRSCSPDVVIWAAGAGGGDRNRTVNVDRDGAIKTFAATAASDAKRYIIVSAIDMRDRKRKPVPSWYNDGDIEASDNVWSRLGLYMESKLAADTNLVIHNKERQLDFTIVRPGRLSTEPGVGTVDAGKVHLGNAVSREDVAAVIVACIKNKGTIGMAFDVVGGEVPISDAVQKVVQDKADTFKEYH